MTTRKRLTPERYAASVRDFLHRAQKQSTSEEEGTASWNTPTKVLAPVRAFFGGRIDLDPCSNEHSIVDAKTAWTKEDDGLARPWKKYAHVFMNPPYGAAMRPWVYKARSESLLAPIEIIGLLAGRIEQSYIQQVAFPPAAAAICLWRGRVVFGSKGKFKSPAMFPSILPYWGPNPEKFRLHFSPHGAVWTR